jgi:glutathione S-transferase
MRLIGMLDSPYVRRVAISLRLMGLPFAHESLSVFRTYDQFAAVNPVVKAPTLVTADGVVLMDSGLILDHAERLAAPAASLMPADSASHTRSLRLIGLALAGTEKAVQRVYEEMLRPAEKRHQPWMERTGAQMLAAFDLLEAEIGDGTGWLLADRPMQADVTAAVAFYFSRAMRGDDVDWNGRFPRLAALSARAEALPAFRDLPHD